MSSYGQAFVQAELRRRWELRERELRREHELAVRRMAAAGERLRRLSRTRSSSTSPAPAGG